VSGRRAGSVRLLRDHKGTAALEGAVGFVLILCALMGVFEMGRLFFAQRAIDVGTLKAARWIAVTSSSVTAANVKSQFIAAITPALGSTSANTCTASLSAPAHGQAGCIVNVTVASSYAPGNTVTVQAQYPWTPVATILKMGAVTVTSEVVLTIQH